MYCMPQFLWWGLQRLLHCCSVQARFLDNKTIFFLFMHYLVLFNNVFEICRRNSDSWQCHLAALHSTKLLFLAIGDFHNCTSCEVQMIHTSSNSTKKLEAEHASLLKWQALCSFHYSTKHAPPPLSSS